MSATLTENVVLVRTRSHDLNSVRKLNCWGCALKDVSIVHRMPNVEVISLSINSIDTLENFASCSMLQELYLRKNEIKDINEILHLSQLQFLKKLSLEDNPCTNAENYRSTVLKALPNLEYLDNIRVTPDEIYQAEKLGKDLVWPGSECDESTDDEINNVPIDDTIETYVNVSVEPNGSGGVHTNQQDSHTYMNASAENADEVAVASSTPYNDPHVEEPEQAIIAASSSSYQSNHHNSISHTNRSSTSHLACANGTIAANYQHQPQALPPLPPQQHSRESGHTANMNGIGKMKTNMAKSNSLSDYNLYHNGNYRTSSPPPLSAVNNYEPSEYGYENMSTSGQTFSTPSSYHSQNGSTRTVQSSASSQSRLLPKGGKNRNANILSAVLCLIKELDYGSLEVVDTTIHCRMEEMED